MVDLHITPLLDKTFVVVSTCSMDASHCVQAASIKAMAVAVVMTLKARREAAPASWLVCSILSFNASPKTKHKVK
jgi:hypothetical protein